MSLKEEEIFNTSSPFFPYYTIEYLYHQSSSFSSCLSLSRTTQSVSSTDRSQSPTVDVLCINPSLSNEFSGEESKLQYLPMKLRQYLEGFLHVQDHQPHYLNSLQDIQLYLSQVPIEIIYDSLSLPSLPFPSIFQYLKIFQINLWINITPVKSSLHFDSNHNLLHVIQGWKDVILISPEYSSYLSSHPVYSISCNHSMLSSQELEDVIESHHLPVVRIRVNAGEGLFIPEGWWHQVSSGSCTYAMNYWFRSPLHNLLTDAGPSMLPYFLRTSLHMMISHQLESKKSCAMNSVGSGNNLRNQFANASIEEMEINWLPFAKQDPKRWVDLLLSLTDEECYQLITTWEKAETTQENSSSMKLSIQELCQELLSPVVEGITSLEVVD